MKLIWSKESRKRLFEIEAYIAQDNPAKASQFVGFLISEALLIEDNPDLGRIVPEFDLDEIREILIKGYRIVYKKSTENIIILTVFEGQRLIRKSEIVNENF